MFITQHEGLQVADGENKGRISGRNSVLFYCSPNLLIVSVPDGTAGNAMLVVCLAGE